MSKLNKGKVFARVRDPKTGLIVCKWIEKKKIGKDESKTTHTEEMIEVDLKQYDTLISLLNATKSFEVFSEKETLLETIQLPFFNDYVFLSAQAFSCIPPVTFHFLWNKLNNDIIALKGTRDAVFENLEKLDLILNEETIVPYVKFVLDNVYTEKGSLRLVEKVDEIEFSENPTKEEMDFLKENIRPAKLIKNEDKYLINCIVIYGTEIFQSEIELQKDGIFEFLSETELRAGMNCLRVIF